MKRIRFWGTRGSLPVALTAAGVRDKVVGHCARRPAGRSRRRTRCTRSSTALACRCPAATAGTRRASRSRPADPSTCYATWAPACVRSASRRSRATAPHPRRPTTSSCRTCTGTTSWASRFSCPPIVPGNRIRIYGGHPDLEACVPAAAGAAVLSGGLLGVAREHRIHPPRARHAARRRGDEGGAHAAEAWRRLVRLPLQRRAAGPSSTPPTPSTRWPMRPRPQRYVDFFRDADVVIFDAMYSLADAISVKADWGHSSNIVGVELCQLAAARQLCLFHHEPIHDDDAIARILAETQRYEEITRTARAAARHRRLRRDGNRVVSDRCGSRVAVARDDAHLGDRIGGARGARGAGRVAAFVECAAAVGVVRCVSGLRAAQSRDHAGHRRRDRREEHRAAGPVAVAADRAGAICCAISSRTSLWRSASTSRCRRRTGCRRSGCSKRARHDDPILAARLAALPSNDTELAAAIRAGPVVLSLAGTPDPTGKTLRAPPFTIFDPAQATPLRSTLPRHLNAFRRRASQHRRARPRRGRARPHFGQRPGREASSGASRWCPRSPARLVPALSIEMLRVALHARGVRLQVAGRSVRGVSIGNFMAPTEEDGSMRIYYSPRDPRRYVSAIDVLRRQRRPGNACATSWCWWA